MIRTSAQRPSERLDETNNWRRIRRYENNEKLRNWELEVEQRPAEMKARVLPPPRLVYRNDAQPRDGAWNLRGQRFAISGVELDTPVVINFTNRNPSLCESFVNKLLAACAGLGMNIRASRVQCRNAVDDPARVRSIFEDAGRAAFHAGGKKTPPQLFICFVDTQNGLYEEIKRVACMELATTVPTQCLNVKKAFNERGQDQYLGNVAMKINIKLGGCNQLLPEPRDTPKMGQNTMLIGLDVTHPPMKVERPSIVAAVTTLNGSGTKIGNQILTQTNPDLGHQQETILESRTLFTKLLSMWQKENNGQLPANIIVLRDGVSQGEYMRVKGTEVTQLKQACVNPKFGKYSPKIVYVVSTKRHRTRLFAKDQRDVDRSGNLPAGTVVDSVITHPYIFE